MRRLLRSLVAGAAVTMPIVVAPGATLGAQGTARARILPVSCSAPSGVTPAAGIPWRGTDVRWGEWLVRLGEGGGVAARIVVVTFDPRRVRLALDVVQRDGALQPWNLEAVPSSALLAFNAGQFTDDGPWGWVVHRGREWQAPGAGSLAGAVVIDSTGAVRVVAAREIGDWRGAPAMREAFQSYPTLLEGEGAVPAGLCAGAPTVDRTHRDTRLALGVRRDGNVVVAMSRYDGVALPDRTPIGPTTPEMAEIMRRLGAVRAIMLDGGLSAQLLVRDGGVLGARRWPGLRDVPLALVGRIGAPN